MDLKKPDKPVMFRQLDIFTYILILQLKLKFKNIM